MRCKHLVERNGYYTGNKCSREATCVVTFPGGKPEPLCTQHKNMDVKRAWWFKPETVEITPLPKEK